MGCRDHLRPAAYCRYGSIPESGFIAGYGGRVLHMCFSQLLVVLCLMACCRQRRPMPLPLLAFIYWLAQIQFQSLFITERPDLEDGFQLGRTRVCLPESIYL